MEFGSRENNLQDIHMFNTLIKLLFEEPWTNDSTQPLFYYLPTKIQTQVHEGILNNFKSHLKGGVGFQINFTLLLFNEIYKMQVKDNKE